VWNWYRKHRYPNPSRPVRTALMLALIRRLSYLAALAAIPWPGSPPEEDDPSAPFLMEARVATNILAHARQPEQEVRETCSEVCDLLTWLRPPPTNQDVNAVLGEALETLKSRVEGDADLLKLLSLVIRGGPQGHPSSGKRVLWVEAYEMRLRSMAQRKTLSYMRIVNKLCNCGQNCHTQMCKANIRQGIRKLERFLQKYDIEPLTHSSPQRPRK